jgi:hypothetical protein
MRNTENATFDVHHEHNDSVFPSEIVVSGGPPIIHGGGGGGDGGHSAKGDSIWSEYKDVIIGVCVGVGVLGLVIFGGVLWFKKLKTRQAPRNHDEMEQLLSNVEGGTDTADPPPTNGAVDQDRANQDKHQLELRFPTDSEDVYTSVSISMKTGGVRFSHDFGILVFPDSSLTSETIIAASCNETGVELALPSGVIPLSNPVRLLPDRFVHNEKMCVVFRVRDDICIPHGCKLSLWHRSDDSIDCTEVPDSVCHLHTQGRDRYIACWSKYHCVSVPCAKLSVQEWKLIAEVYVELLDGAISGVHVFLADSHQTVQKAIELHCSATELVPIAVVRPFELVSGFSHLLVNMEAIPDQALSREVTLCCCQTGPGNIQHVVFSGSSIPQYTLRISTCCIDATYPPAGESCIQSHRRLLCEERIDLRRFPHADSSQLDTSQASTHCDTWCQPLTERDQCVPECYQSRALKLRQQGTPLRRQHAVEIKDWFHRIGLTVEMLLLIAERLDSRLQQHLTREFNGTDESDVATNDQVEKLVDCYQSVVRHPCVEEIISCFLSVLNQSSLSRVRYDLPPECSEPD